MRVLLIDPPFHTLMGYYRFYFPLGLTYLAAVLKEAGHEVLIYDADQNDKGVSLSMREAAESHHLYLEALENDLHPSWQGFKKKLEEFKPQVVGISVLTVKVASAAKIARITKAHDRSIVVVAGGEHVTVRPQDVPVDCVDHVICGEGEQGFSSLMKGLTSGDPNPRVVDSQLVEDLDSLPLPELDCLHDISLYRPLDLGLMVTARGCPFSCTFCSLATIWGRRVRYHSLDRVIREIKLRKVKYGTNYFSFRNGTFTLKRQRVVDFCQRLLAQDMGIKWECLTRVDVIDKELVGLMRRAGCDVIRVGVESGSDEILKYMKKGITLAKIRKAANILNSSGMYWAAYFMLGVPNETEETVKESLKFIKEINPPFVTLARYTPLPGTAMYEDVVTRGLLDPNETDWAWASNQSISKPFVESGDNGRLTELMDEASQLVKEHNAHNEVVRSDVRLRKAV